MEKKYLIKKNKPKKKERKKEMNRGYTRQNPQYFYNSNPNQNIFGSRSIYPERVYQRPQTYIRIPTLQERIWQPPFPTKTKSKTKTKTKTVSKYPVSKYHYRHPHHHHPHLKSLSRRSGCYSAPSYDDQSDVRHLQRQQLQYQEENSDTQAQLMNFFTHLNEWRTRHFL